MIYDGKMLLVAQFTNQDVNEMLALVKLICDLREDDNLDADILFMPKPEVRRWDTSILSLAKLKFDRVDELRGARPLTGWPMGPNALAMDAFAATHQMMRRGRFRYMAAMLLESDCIPTKRNWLEEIRNEYAECGKLVLGHYDPMGKQPHVNGNLVFHPNLIEKNPHMAYGNVPMTAWDYVFWPEISQDYAASRTIFSDYRLGTSKNPWKGCGHLFAEKTFPKGHPYEGQKFHPSWFHGIKTEKGLLCARERLLGK
jgi:hypothetical protein